MTRKKQQLARPSLPNVNNFFVEAGWGIFASVNWAIIDLCNCLPSHYVNQYLIIVNWTIGFKCKLLLLENAFHIVVINIATILSEPQYRKLNEY